MTSRPHSPPDADDLLDRLTAEMRERWRAGDRVATEELLLNRPDLRSDPGAVGELIFEEICLRREAGESGISGDVVRRFPDLEPQIRVLLAVRDALEPELVPVDLAAGDRVGEFVVVEELGRGLSGRVFRAVQSSLGDRSMVLKVTHRPTAEPDTLARLQHTNIVPLYSAFDDPARNARVLCMPDFGGGTLADLLGRLRSVPPADRTAAGMWSALVGGGGPAPPAWWARSDAVGVVCRIGCGLADGLQFAHDRNYLHLDVKPANVLITAEGQPMLLDFHLALSALAAGDLAPLGMGGTAPYLSPEHRAALDAVRHGRPVETAVDGRTDVYGLGVVLYEALAGLLPNPEYVIPLCRVNSCVSPGLSDVVGRCLAARADDRYPTAAALADDLRRHLGGQPLAGVRNRSVVERWRKWRHRRPHALGGLIGLAALCVLVGFGADDLSRRRDQVRAALADGEAELGRGQFANARETFRRGLAAGAYLPSRWSLMDPLTDGVRRADRAERVAELHATVDRLRGMLGVTAVTVEEQAAAEPLDRLVRERREELFAAVRAAGDDPGGQRVRADAADLVLLWSHLTVRLAPLNRAGPAREDAVRLLTEAELVLGAHPGLARDRAEFLDKLGRPAEALAAHRHAEEIPVRSADDHFVVGCFDFRASRIDRAKDAFESVVVLDPASYWGWYYLGQCHFARGRYPEAAVAFGVCTGINPENPSAYVQKAQVHLHLRQKDDAILCLDRAQHLDPRNSVAARLRKDVELHQ